jgi:predicted DNA-binding WGR domain protein
LLSTFAFRVSFITEDDGEDHEGLVKEMVDEVYDFEGDSEKYIEEKFPEIEKEVEEEECVVDSTGPTEKYWYVVKDEDTGYCFDALMKKVDVKKYYYGLDNFYVLQMLRDDVKSLYIIWTRWGRSGTAGQFQRTPFGKLEDAVKEFNRIFKQKSGWAWKDVKDYVKKKGKYDVKRLGGKFTTRSDVKLKFSNTNVPLEKLFISMDDLDYNAEMINPIEFKFFIKPLINDMTIMTHLRSQQFPTSIMLLAPQDKQAIDIAIEILNKMKNIMKETDRHRRAHKFAEYSDWMQEISDLNSDYLEVIPKINPTKIQCLMHPNQVDQEIKLLKSAFTLSYSIRSILGAYFHQARINPYDYVLGTLGAHLSVVDPNSEETNLILHYLNSDNNRRNYNLRNVIKVEPMGYSEEEDDRFQKTKNHMMLWHGTSATNVLSIIRSGLKIAPVDAEFHGARYGKGIYLSDSFNLSSWFSAESEQEMYIFLWEAATGNMVNMLSNSNPELKYSENYDCIRAMSMQGPDWDGSVFMHDVIYPIGKTIYYPQPYLSKEGDVKVSSLNEFKSLIQKRASNSSSKKKVTDRGDFEVVEDTEEDDDDQRYKVSTILQNIKSAQIKKKGKNINESELVVLQPSNSDGEIYPTFPEEITAMSKNDLKMNSNYGYSYYSNHAEYIIYDDALVRIRYIIQLSMKSAAALAKGRLTI